MKTLAQNFLNQDEQARITQAVHRAELVTSGEIVPMVVSNSSVYPSAITIAGLLPAFLLSFAMTPFVGKAFWLGSNNMLLFVSLFIVLFFLFFQLARMVPSFKRFFLSREEIDREVEKYALASFFQEQLYKTRDENGILIFISVFERKVVILGDSGINSKIDPAVWKSIVDTITSGIREKRQCDAICKAVKQVGAILKDHFPIKEDDVNELHDLIIR